MGRSFLTELEFFSKFTTEEIDRMKSLFRTQRIEPWTNLYREGDDASGLFVVVSGSVALHRNSPDGEAVVIARLPRGSVVGAVEVLDLSPRMTSCSSENQPTVLASLNRQDLGLLTGERGPLSFKVLSALGRELGLLLRHLDDCLVTRESKSEEEQAATPEARVGARLSSRPPRKSSIPPSKASADDTELGRISVVVTEADRTPLTKKRY